MKQKKKIVNSKHTLGLDKVAALDTLLEGTVEEVLKVVGGDLEVALDVLLEGLTAKIRRGRSVDYSVTFGNKKTATKQQFLVLVNDKDNDLPGSVSLLEL